MVEITVRHPLSSIIKIATKSSCPEMLSFTYGEKLTNKPDNEKPQKNETDQVDKTKDKKETEPSIMRDNSNEYNIKGKDWFFIPDYAGEAASAVKLQILQIIDLV